MVSFERLGVLPECDGWCDNHPLPIILYSFPQSESTERCVKLSYSSEDSPTQAVVRLIIFKLSLATEAIPGFPSYILWSNLKEDF
jgi:hypothetical protein